MLSDKTVRTIANLRKYIEDNPKELEDINYEVGVIADKLESKELTLIKMSYYFKKWKKAHGQILYTIFVDAYKKAEVEENQDEPTT